ncbi:MAG TPA: AI-2E family transporter [Vicinamibacterales bacterium]|nr:AI-2E family transporter [Vicinamibacterales bacterium]
MAPHLHNLAIVLRAVTTRYWIAFAGCLLIVFVLDWAEAVLVPVAVALLFTFLLNPPVMLLQRWIRRGPAVILVVMLTCGGLATLGWVLTRQISSLALELPRYRQTIRQKVADVRQAVRGGAVEQVQSTIDDIKREIGGPVKARAPQAVVVQEPDNAFGMPAWFSALLDPLANVGLVTVLVIFMLLEHGDMRDRLVGVIGSGRMATTTKALDEAATRVSRYLLMQSLVNAGYGMMIGFGLFFIGTPYPILWAALGAALRFIPYLGPWIAAGAPTVITLAALPGWTPTLWVAGMFVVVEIFTNLVLETVLYAGVAGVTQTALLVAVAFWTWLWGPLGLLLATPLTVCVVVLGKHVNGLRGMSMMMSDEPPLSEDARYYQRLLAGEPGDAWELIDAHRPKRSPSEVFGEIMLPALICARRDVLEGRLSPDDEAKVSELTKELLTLVEREPTSKEDHEHDDPPMPTRLRVLGCPISGPADAAALQMLKTLLAETSIELDIGSPQQLVAEIAASVDDGHYDAVCLVDVPPTSTSRLRYAIKQLRRTRPDLPIFVGRWGAAPDGDAEIRALSESGTTHIGRALTETRDGLQELSARSGPGAAPPTNKVSAA